MLLIKYVNKYCMVLTASRYKGSMKSLRLRKVNKKTYIKEEQTIQWREEKKTSNGLQNNLRLIVQP